MINLDRFLKRRKHIVPIVKGEFTTKTKRKISLTTLPNTTGWNEVTIGDNYLKIKNMSLLCNSIEKIRNLFKHKFVAYTFENDVIPQSWNTLKQWGYIENPVSIRINVLNQDIFGEPLEWDSILVGRWEDGNYYYLGNANKNIELLIQLKEVYDIKETLVNIKNITPELRYLFFLYSFERLTLEEIEKTKVAEEEKVKFLKRFNESLGGRLKLAIETAGGTLLKFKKTPSGNIEVDWMVGNETFNSVIKPDTFQCLEAGYCVENEDSKLNIKSAVLTAQDYIDKDLIYKTRT